MRILRSNRCRLCIFCVMLVFIPACATGQVDSHPAQKETVGQNTAAAAQPASSTHGTDPNNADVLGSLWTDVWTLPDTIIEESLDILDTDKNLMYLLLAGGASIAMHNTNMDSEIAENFNLNRALGKEVDEIVSNLGGPGVHFAVTGLWYAISVDKGDELNKQRSWTMMKALSVTGATTITLKLIVNNDTPNEKWPAWPSGHTASSFTVASVLDELYGPEVGFPAYLAAGFVGYRMMDSGDHWASDVVFGAVLGWIVGHHIGREQKMMELAGFEINPYTNITPTGPAVGISLVKRF